MSFPAYPEYKDSGVAWLGDLPSHWEVAPLKRQVHLVTQRADQRSFPVALENIEGWTGRFLPTDTEFEGDGVAFEPGDILYGKLRPYLAKILVAEGHGEAIGDFHVLRPSGQASDYLSYFLRTKELVSVVDGSTYGSKMPRASWDFLGSLLVSFPPLVEQHAVAAFLDRETAKIDALVAEQERLIALLKEKRRAVISHAVTKGLNPDAPMKDSGIEWLGEIPAHWEVLALKRACSLLRDGTHQPPSRVDDGVPLLSVRNIQDGCFSFREDDSQISEADYDELCRSFAPNGGDVLLAVVGATLGKSAIVPQCFGRFHIQRSLAIFRPNSATGPDWLNYLFTSDGFQRLMWSNVGFSAQPGIYLGSLANFCVPMPPVHEQLAIVETITPAVSSLEALLFEAQAAITLLQERRAALISAAVTGKIDVRGAVTAEPAMEDA